MTWQGYGAPAVTKTGCVDGPVATEGTTTLSCSVTTTAAPILTSGPVSETVKLDTVAPSTAVTLTPTAVGAWYSPRTVTLTATDATSGVASTSYRVDGGPWTPYTGTFSIVTYGPHTLDFRSTDVAGNVEATKTTSWGSDFTVDQQIDGLSDFTASLGLDKQLEKSLQNDLKLARKLDKDKQECHHLGDFENDVLDAAGGKKPTLTPTQAAQLLSVRQIEALIGC